MTKDILNKGEKIMTALNMVTKGRVNWASLTLLLFLVTLLSQTGVSRAADLLHNSAGTGSTKWQSQGGWGVQGGKYGQFVCATCHEPDADNIKNVRSVLSTMTSNQKWPNGQRSVSVSFPNVTSMGDDTKARTSSNRICEVCHSQNKFHNYSTTSNLSHGGALQHPSPKQRCTSCHLHNTGFKAGCSCHGSPPTSASFGNNTGLVGSPRVSNAIAPGQAGAHFSHVRKRNLSCDDCHHITDGSLQMPTLSNTIQIGFFGFGGKVTSGTYVPYSSTNRGYAVRASAQNTTIATPVTNYAGANYCQNVYCHGGGIKVGGTQVRAPMTAQNQGLLMQTPKWDGGPQNLCGKCHGADTSNPPNLGSHIKHAASTGGYAFNCDTCHPQNDNASHVQGSPQWRLQTTNNLVGPNATYLAYSATAPAATGWTGNPAPSRFYGQCNNIYCHSNARGGAGTIAAPTWGNSSPFVNCLGCHKGNVASGSPLDTGKHGKHINNAGYLGTNYGCVACHAQTVSNDTTIKSTTSHVNFIKNYSGAKAGKNKNSCNAAYCHSSGKAVAGTFVNWSSTSPAQFATCGGCHGNDPAPAFASIAGEPNYQRGPAGSLTANSHLTHTTDISVAPTAASSCAVCHIKTATSAGLAVLGTYSAHINKRIDVDFDLAKAGATASYTKTSRTCNTILCHSNGSPVWGSDTGCTTCHGTLKGAHAAHVSDLSVTFYAYTANQSSGQSYRYGCSTCHPTDKDTYHQKLGINIDLSYNAPNVGSMRQLNKAITAPGTGYTKIGIESEFYCDNVYCHSDGSNPNTPNYKRSPNWYGTLGANYNRCAMCHGNPPTYAGQSHYNPASHIGDNGVSTPTETGHMVGIHFQNTYVGNKLNGFLGFSSSGNKAHGNSAYATTISCYTCHSDTVSSSRIDTFAMYSSTSSFRCANCHKSNSRTPLQSGRIDNTRMHINGVKDVKFTPSGDFRTKAQLINNNNAPGWGRNKAYKSYSSYDTANLSVGVAERTTVPGKVTCTTLCHVNQPGITWGTQLKCVSCHANQ